MQNATRPDVDRLISGGQARKRRRTRRRAGGAALVLVLAGGVYAVTQLDGDTPEASEATGGPTAAPEVAVSPDVPPSLPDAPGGLTIEPGTYRLLVGFDRLGAQVDADLTFGTRDWRDGNFPIVQVGAFVGGVGVYQPHGLAAGSGCSGDRLNTDLGRVELVKWLARLPGSTVLRPVTRVRAFGHDASHVRVRIDDDCPAGQAYRVAETARGGRGVSYSYLPTKVTVGFWVVDLGTASVVVR